MDEATIVGVIREHFGALLADGALDLADDVAVLPPVPARSVRVVSTDVVIEREDFDLSFSSTESAGHRAVVQNLSDLAAKGAKPVGMTWTLALPASWLAQDMKLLRGFLRGAAKQCETHGLRLYGGDLSLVRGPFSCSITVFGDVKGKPLLRSGAKPGDRVFLSWWLGASAMGLKVLRNKKKRAAGSRTKLESQAVLRHLWPIPELALGQGLVGKATACIDITDGLLRDLGRVARASSVGVVVREDSLFACTDPAAGKGKLGREHALHGGEDYALLFTAPPAFRPKRAHYLGDVVEGAGLVLRTENDELVPLAERGFDHFERLAR